jgi:hypothetical protein
VSLCVVQWYHFLWYHFFGTVEPGKKLSYNHFCYVEVATTLRFPGFYPPIYPDETLGACGVRFRDTVLGPA